MIRYFTFFCLIGVFLSGNTFGQDLEVFESGINKVDALSERMHQLERLKSIDDLTRYKGLNDISIEIKTIAPDFHKNVLKDIDSDKPLHGSQLTLLHKIVGLFLELDYKLMRLAESSKKEVLKVRPLLDRFENFEIVYLPYYKEKEFRRLVNAEDRSYEVERKELKRQLRELVKKNYIEDVKNSFYSLRSKVNAGTIRRNSPLVAETLDSFGYRLIHRKKYWRKWRRRIFRQVIADFGSRVGRNIVHHASGAFGNGMGSIRWRKGWLWKDKKVYDEIVKQLKPLDVITEKVSYTPTDFFIPGHFGHNAIWLGTKEQLQELGIWDHPVVKPHQETISAGKSIIETDRSGTHFKSLKDFMNVDEFGLLRFRNDTLDVQNERSKVLKVYEVAFAQLGKTYDFNFDVETTDKLVCSELLYQSFGDVNWPTEPYIGRTTISPDNVVSLALFDNPPIDLIYYVQGTKDGRYIYKDKDDLASDIGFVKKDDLYKKPYKECRTERVRKPGGRPHEKINRRICDDKLEDLIYIPHAPLPDLTANF
jgi:hypothetical protein